MATSKASNAIRIPRHRRRAQPFIVVVPERPSYGREVLSFFGTFLWKARRTLAPTVIATSAFLLAAILHTVAWWSCFLLAPVIAAPLLWVSIAQHSHPALGTEKAWRIGLAITATLAASWLAAAAAFGPLSGPLDIVWLLALIGAQTTWLAVRRTH